MKITVEFEVGVAPTFSEKVVREGFISYLTKMDLIEGPVDAEDIEEGPGPFWVETATITPSAEDVAEIAFDAICTLQTFEFSDEEFKQGKSLGRKLDILFGREVEDDDEDDERELYDDEREPCADDLLRD